MSRNNLYGTPRKGEALRARSYHVNQLDDFKIIRSPHKSPATTVFRYETTPRIKAVNLDPARTTSKKRPHATESQQPPSIKRQRYLVKHGRGGDERNNEDGQLRSAANVLVAREVAQNNKEDEGVKATALGQNPMARKDEKAEWRAKYLQAMPKFVFHFSGVDGETAAKLTKQVNALGSRVEAFFDRSVSHVITTQMAIDLLEATRATKETPADCPRTATNEARIRNETVSYGALTTMEKRQKRLLPAIGPFADAPSFQPDTSTLQLALEFKMKVWSVTKFASMLRALIPDAAQMLRARSHGDLRAMLQDERIHGTRDRDPDAPRNDMHYFTGHYMLVEDATGTHRPIATKEYKAPANEFDYPWPVMHPVEPGRVPFGHLAPQSVEHLHRKNMINNAKKDKENEKTNPLTKETLLPAWDPKKRTRDSTSALKRSASLTSLQAQGAGLAPPAFVKTANSQSTGVQCDKDEIPASVVSGYISSNATNIPPTTTSAIPLTGNCGPRQGDARLELLNRRVLGNLPTQTTLSKPPATHSTHRRAASSAALPQVNTQEDGSADTLISEDEQLVMYELFKAFEAEFSEELGKPGYCENCKGKFENFNTHLIGRRHRKFAEDDLNWEDIDEFMIRSDRKPKCCDLWETGRSAHVICPDCADEYCKINGLRPEQHICWSHEIGWMDLIKEQEAICCCLDTNEMAVVQRAQEDGEIIDIAHLDTCPYHRWQKNLARVLRLHRTKRTPYWRKWILDVCQCSWKNLYLCSRDTHQGTILDEEMMKCTIDTHHFNCPVTLFFDEKTIHTRSGDFAQDENPEMKPWRCRQLMAMMTDAWLQLPQVSVAGNLSCLPMHIQLYSCPPDTSSQIVNVSTKIRQICDDRKRQFAQRNKGLSALLCERPDLVDAGYDFSRHLGSVFGGHSSHAIRGDEETASGPSTPQARRTMRAESIESDRYGTCHSTPTSAHINGTTDLNLERQISMTSSTKHTPTEGTSQEQDSEEDVADSESSSEGSVDEDHSTSLGTADSTPVEVDDSMDEGAPDSQAYEEDCGETYFDSQEDELSTEMLQ